MRYLTILIFLFSLQSFAEESCTDISISTENMPKNNNQGETGWCDFWASSDLFSYYEKTPLSSYDLALQYFNNDIVRTDTLSDHSNSGANISAALILGLQGKGVCLESQTNFTNSDWFVLSQFFNKISSPDKKLSRIICENQFQDALPFKNISPDILKILDPLTGDKKTAALLDLTCGKRHQLGKYGVGSKTIENSLPEKIVEKLDTLLSTNNPAAIAYDWYFLLNDKDYIKKDANHTSTIIGRRLNSKTNQCEYQIKDTAGNRCPTHTKYECSKENGTFWVPRNILIKNVYELSWLVKAKS